MKKLFSLLLITTFLAGVGPVGMAGAAMSNEQMMQKIVALESKVQELESKLGSEGSEAVEGAAGGIEISGGISTSSVWNFNSPDDSKNQLRAFDTAANSFNVDLVEIVAQKSFADTGLGARVDLDFLETAEVITASGTTRDDLDVQQAYVTYSCPLTGIDLKAGKFVTMHGSEVIEPWDNWNYSRSFLFTYAIPFTHTGLMGSHTFNEYVSAALMVVNGWDNVEDNNEGKTFHGTLTLTPADWATFIINGMIGPEQADENSNMRGLIDLVATIKPQAIPNLTLMANYDYGNESDIPVVALDELTLEEVVVGSSDATWQGIAAYAKYDLCEKSYVAVRWEWFDDEDGARTGTSQELWEVTLTGAYMAYEDLWFRLEYRHDDSDSEPFLDGDSATDTQDTISTNITYLI